MSTRLHAGLHPQGLWTEPCEVRCDLCPWRATFRTCRLAQLAAALHDRAHERHPQHPYLPLKWNVSR